MAKVKSLDDLKRMQAEFKSGNKDDGPESHVRIKVAMATCGIASGAKEVMNFLEEELEKRNIEATIKLTGCMGYCYAEPTIEVKLPGQEPVVFGYVDTSRADAIIEKYIKNNELVDGIIPMNYETID